MLCTSNLAGDYFLSENPTMACRGTILLQLITITLSISWFLRGKYSISLSCVSSHFIEGFISSCCNNDKKEREKRFQSYRRVFAYTWIILILTLISYLAKASLKRYCHSVRWILVATMKMPDINLWVQLVGETRDNCNTFFPPNLTSTLL